MTSAAAEAVSSRRRRILLVFAIQGIVLATLNMRIPDLQLRAGLSDAQLGLILVGGATGAIATYPLAAPVIERFGTRRTILATYTLMALAAAGVATFAHGGAMFAFLLLVGAGSSLSNIAINVEVDRVEADTGARLMNRCHGAWSVVFLLASSVAGLARGLGVAPVLHLWIEVPVYVAATVVLVMPMRESPPREAATVPKRRLVVPTAAVLGLVAFALGADLLEGASRVWATIYLRDAFDVSPMVESMALPALILTMAGVRLVADPWIDRFGPARIARASLTVALAGVALIVFAPWAWVAIAGFAVAGIGSAVVYPLMVSAAARLGDRPAEENVAATTLVFQFVLLVSPMLIGFVAEGFGIRAAFGLFLPLLAIGLAMSGRLR